MNFIEALISLGILIKWGLEVIVLCGVISLFVAPKCGQMIMECSTMGVLIAIVVMIIVGEVWVFGAS
jgi:hypothetical protein